MNDLNLTNMKLLHHFCLKHSKIGQICMRGGPFISSHPVELGSAHNWLSQSFSCDLAEKLPADRSFCQVANDMLATKTRVATLSRSFMSRKNLTISLR